MLGKRWKGRKEEMKKIFTVLLFIADFLLTQFTTMYYWNGIISNIFEIKTINFFETIALSTFLMYIRYNPNQEKIEKSYIETIAVDTGVTLVMYLLGIVVVNFILG